VIIVMLTAQRVLIGTASLLWLIVATVLLWMTVFGAGSFAWQTVPVALLFLAWLAAFSRHWKGWVWGCLVLAWIVALRNYVDGLISSLIVISCLPQVADFQRMWLDDYLVFLGPTCAMSIPTYLVAHCQCIPMTGGDRWSIAAVWIGLINVTLVFRFLVMISEVMFPH
jgi:hypothetical protein